MLAVFIFKPRTWQQLFKSFLKIRKNPPCVSYFLYVDNGFVKSTLKSHWSESKDVVFKYYFGNSDSDPLNLMCTSANYCSSNKQIVFTLIC